MKSMIKFLTIILLVILFPANLVQANNGKLKNLEFDQNNIKTIDFENLADQTDVGVAYASIGVTFQGATILGQGKSLNYLYYPPRSGANVIYDDYYLGTGKIIINIDRTIAGIVTRFGGYVTGNTNVFMTAFDESGNSLGSVQTGGPNYNGVGDPNKLLQIDSSVHIAKIQFSDSGNTFTVDDIFFISEQQCQVETVPLYKQSDPLWRNDAYGGSVSFPWRHGGKETIGNWGCALSSAAMVVSYFGMQQNGFLTTPKELNEWLRTDGNNGYSGGNIQWPKVAEYARKVGGVSLYYYDGRGPDVGVVNGYLCNSCPMILNTISTPYTGHFLVATGIENANSWKINDPGGYNLTQLSTSSYTGYRKFAPTKSDPTSIYITVHSPIELLITDPAGRRTGYDQLTNTYLNEIIDSSYFNELLSDGGINPIQTKIFSSSAPISGAYQIELLGTGNGVFSIDFLGYDVQGDASNSQFSGYIFENTKIALKLNYSEIPGSQLTIEVESGLPTIFIPMIQNYK